MNETAATHHARLIEQLNRPSVWPDGALPDRVIETHISTVLLVGDYAYKIKKPLNLGFLDFSTLSRRHHCCQEEIRLNSRLAPAIYLDVIPISGTIESPRPFADDRIIEYAVRMRRFDQDGLLSLHPERLTPELIDRLAAQLVDFHSRVAVAEPTSAFGKPGSVVQPMRENFAQIRELIADGEVPDQLHRLAEWTEQQYEALIPVLRQRKATGAVRECHGDLHLGNIALNEGELVIFDGIEFNPALRWIDTISELAFLLMDLDSREMTPLARRLLNRYLELSGDYDALPLLRLYLVYRALVRAKVAAIRLAQTAPDRAEQGARTEFDRYLRLALTYIHPAVGGMVITHGLSGSGKSTQTAKLLERMPAIRLRSDQERRRLAGLAEQEPSGSATGEGIYAANFSAQTYDRLLQLAAMIVRAGQVAIVDAAFLSAAQRAPFRAEAESLGVPFLILDFRVPPAILRERVARRQAQGGGDPSEATLAVLERQFELAEPLTPKEQEQAVPVVSDHLPLDKILGRLERSGDG